MTTIQFRWRRVLASKGNNEMKGEAIADFTNSVCHCRGKTMQVLGNIVGLLTWISKYLVQSLHTPGMEWKTSHRGVGNAQVWSIEKVPVRP